MCRGICAQRVTGQNASIPGQAEDSGKGVGRVLVQLVHQVVACRYVQGT